MTDTEQWVRINTGDYAGLVGRWNRQFGTGVYVELRGIGLVLCCVADVELIEDRRVK